MSDDEYTIPLQDQRVFGAGIKRKRVQFVPATSSSTADTVSTPKASSTGESVANFYESLVLAPSRADPSARVTDDFMPVIDKESHTPDTRKDDRQLCEVCHLPLSSSGSQDGQHETSLAHQVCLEHSFPPSHLDPRNRGLQYLSSYGWDPNSRLGLGPSGEGRRFPVKTKVKKDTLGVGAEVPKRDGKSTGQDRKQKETLDAKRVKEREDDERRKAERLHQLFYQSEEVNRYLGTAL
ncbi:MAG: hypothetical protein M1815_001031 [Lichina confinis]|nr:MAG: hypothetical protein M1815_001031 [Lichina confinis]